MAEVTILEASKLTGKSVKTIYRHIENGKVSCVIDDNGRKKIDSSELIRAYGELNKSRDENGRSSQKSYDEKDKTELLRKEIDHLRQIIEEKNKQISIYEKSFSLLEFGKEQKKKQWWKFWSR